MKIHQVHKDLRPEVRYLFFIGKFRLVRFGSSIVMTGYVSARADENFHECLIYKD
jgi:hypothetical protein